MRHQQTMTKSSIKVETLTFLVFVVSLGVGQQNSVAQGESGFSCSKPPCPACKIANSNMQAGSDCACNAGYTGTITWTDNKPAGKCVAAKCDIANSNKKPGKDCACLDGFTGQITWTGTKATGTCKPAPCWILGSNNQPGLACKCRGFYPGKITWKGNKPSGSCTVCGKNSGFNADLVTTINAKAGWTEVKNWRTNGNNEMYETNQNEFNNAAGRFAPKEDGYYLCNANVRLDGFKNAGYSRLVVAVNGKTDVNNGLHTIEGSGGSTDYRSMMVTGNLWITKGQYVSVFVFSSGDNRFRIQGETGFSCHNFDTDIGFHAEKQGDQAMGRGWREITKWRVSGSAGLYNIAPIPTFNPANGRFTAPGAGVFFCSAMIRMDAATASGYFRLNLNLNSAADVSGGFHAIRGNGDSANYGSLNVAGTIRLVKGSYLSVYAYSNLDNSWRVQGQSGWGCHKMGTQFGFHADGTVDQVFGKGWSRISKWRTAGNNELYSMGGAGIDANGYYTIQESGYYTCAAQIRLDSANTQSFRIVIAVNGQIDINNGMHAIEGNRGSTNYRTMRVAGNVYLKKGQKTSVHIFSAGDNSYRFQQESGFSCHKFVSHITPCPACNIANSNKIAGPGCECLKDFKGSIKWSGTKATGTCTKATAPCNTLKLPSPVFERRAPQNKFPVTLGASKDIGIYDTSFVATAWVYSDNKQSDSGDKTIFGAHETGTSKGLHLVVRAKKYYMGFYAQDCGGKTDRKKGVWEQVAFVYDKSKKTQTIVLNGKADGTCTSRNPYAGTGDVHLGTWNKGYLWVGIIKNVKIWNKLIPVNQIKLAMAPTAGGSFGPKPKYERLTLTSKFPVNLGKPQAIGIYDSSFTASAWVYSDAKQSDDGDKSIFGAHETGTSKGLHLVVRGKKYYMGFYSVDCGGKIDRQKGVWEQVAFVYNRIKKSQIIVVNGKVDNACTNRNPYVGTGDVHLGSWQKGNLWVGQIKNVRVWNQNFDVAKIPDMMAEATAGDYNSPDYEGPFSKIKLHFSGNQGAGAVCVGQLKLYKNCLPVPFPPGSKSEHTGIWKSGKNPSSYTYHSDTLINNNGYYCSDRGSFKNRKGSEEVLISLKSPVAFDSFSLRQRDSMIYNPRIFTLMGLGADGTWRLLHEESDFNFISLNARVVFDTVAKVVFDTGRWVQDRPTNCNYVCDTKEGATGTAGQVWCCDTDATNKCDIDTNKVADSNCDADTKPPPKLCPKRDACGTWIQGEPSGCETTCGLEEGTHGSAGLVTCKKNGDAWCDKDFKPDPKQCPSTPACETTQHTLPPTHTNTHIHTTTRQMHSIAKIINSSPNLKTFGTAIHLATLHGANFPDLSSSAESLTIFAPTNNAFDELPTDTLTALFKDSKGELADMLRYHATHGRKLSSDLINGFEMKALNGDVFKVKVKTQSFDIDKNLPHIMVNNALVVTTDILASNGVIHVIDKIVQPPSISDIIDSYNHKPVSPEKLTTCLQSCRGTVKHTFSHSCNKIISCDIACMIRDLGIKRNACIDLCYRHPGGACTFDVLHKTFNLCGETCDVEDSKDSDSSKKVQQCIKGCNRYRLKGSWIQDGPKDCKTDCWRGHHGIPGGVRCQVDFKDVEDSMCAPNDKPEPLTCPVPAPCATTTTSTSTTTTSTTSTTSTSFTTTSTITSFGIELANIVSNPEDIWPGTAGLIGAIFGLLAILAIVVAVIWVVIARKKKKEGLDPQNAGGRNDFPHLSRMDTNCDNNRNPGSNGTDSELRIIQQKVEEELSTQCIPVAIREKVLTPNVIDAEIIAAEVEEPVSPVGDSHSVFHV